MLEVKSAPGASARSESPARLRNKRAMMKGLADPLNLHLRHGRACILCQLRAGRQVYSDTSPYFHPAFSQSALLFLCESLCTVCAHPGAGVLVKKQNAGETRTCCHLHHHSLCLSRCSPYGLATYCRCMESLFLEPILVGHR